MFRHRYRDNLQQKMSKDGNYLFECFTHSFFQADAWDVLFIHPSLIIDIDQIISPEMMIYIAIKDVNKQASNIIKK